MPSAGMDKPNSQLPETPQPLEQSPTLVARIARLLTEYTERQTPNTQAAIARALILVNAWLSRFQKK